MAEQFDHRDLIITLCCKGQRPARITPPYDQVEFSQIVEVNLRGRDGNWHNAEIPLEEFHKLIYKEVFPAVARRMQGILRKKS